MPEKEQEKKQEKSKKDAPEQKSEDEISKKKFPLKLIVIMVTAVAVMGGGGAAAYFLLSKDTKGSQRITRAAEELSKQEQSTTLGPIVMLDTFIVNLAESNGRRYLKVAMGLELSDQKLQEEINNKLPQVRDSVLLLLSTKSFDEIRTSQGKILLREEILRRLNGFLTSGMIKKVYFTDFVVQ